MQNSHDVNGGKHVGSRVLLVPACGPSDYCTSTKGADSDHDDDGGSTLPDADRHKAALSSFWGLGPQTVAKERGLMG
jgi:hypothetical protein